MKFSELLAKLGIDLTEVGADFSNGDPKISGVATLADATASDLGFLENNLFFRQVAETNAAALIIGDEPEAIALVKSRSIPHVAVRQPRLLFAKAIALFHPPYLPDPSIHPSATIAPDVQLGESVYIGAHVVIGAGCQIGSHVYIYPNVTIYEGVSIGDRTVLHANCVIHARSVIGDRCTIHSGAAIGSEGFGFVPSSDGTWTKMLQVGRTILEDDVEVGCNAAIDRGALGDTHIGRGTKIDNLVQIGHGCKTAENCLMAGQVGLAGGVELGKNVILAGQVGITNHIKVGDRAVAAAQSGIAHDVEAGTQVMGYPAIPAKTFFKATAVFRRLPELNKMVRELQKQLDNLVGK
ncbi:UDP-3-O-(3-hydroxymyristoyl)glucosamine N-acyltransferase [Tumidithrix helvetica PCC 7403]|uniref:UDP-3-O-(3-hydroxymyristoyl)glucosamine N-acyltransferase n=1 Tax=Tumidithrix helvetica TaxID=3457545 RepID=UPI003C8BF040